MSDALFYDRSVLRVIRAVLVTTGIRAEQDLEDGIADVVLACIEYVRKTGRPPENAGEASTIARLVANTHGVDEARRRARRGKTNVDSTGDADEHAGEAGSSADLVHRARALAVIHEALKQEQIETLSDVGAGVTFKELAADDGASEAALRKRVQVSREKARAALRAGGYAMAGGFATLLLGALAVHFGSSGGPDVVSHQPPLDEPHKAAANLRHLAVDACKDRRWDDCEAALDRAAELDAPGDRHADVSALRASIAEGREAGTARP